MTLAQAARKARIAALNREIRGYDAQIRALDLKIAASNIRIVWYSGGNWLIAAGLFAYLAHLVTL